MSIGIEYFLNILFFNIIIGLQFLEIKGIFIIEGDLCFIDIFIGGFVLLVILSISSILKKLLNYFSVKFIKSSF
jgi:hypothetical protein